MIPPVVERSLCAPAASWRGVPTACAVRRVPAEFGKEALAGTDVFSALLLLLAPVQLLIPALTSPEPTPETKAPRGFASGTRPDSRQAVGGELISPLEAGAEKAAPTAAPASF